MAKLALRLAPLLVLATLLLPSVQCSLQPHFYRHTCREYPGLLRMFFHDCFVRGCDASVLLNSTNGVPAERDAPPNLSLHGFEVIDAIKAKLESIPRCKGIVSCADILASATRDAVLFTSGIFWHLRLGRRDGSISLASEVNLPSPFENATTLINKFAVKGFNAQELVLLQGGGHSIGVGHCQFFLNRLANFNNTGKPDPTINPAYLKQLVAQCNGTASVTANLDPVTPILLDKQYFENVRNLKGLFSSDQELLFDSRTSATVLKYARAGEGTFVTDFAVAMQKLSEVEVLTGTQGSIRTNCAIAAPQKEQRC